MDIYQRTCAIHLLFALLNLVTIATARNYHFGVLLPFTGNRALGHITAGAVTMAVDRLNTDPTLSELRAQGHTFSFTWRDTESRMNIGLSQFVNMWSHAMNREGEEPQTVNTSHVTSIDAFIGPAMDDICEPAAILAAEWGIPVISYGCSSSLLSNKVKFSTFSRTTSPYKWLAPMVKRLMDRFDWTRVMLVQSSHHVWQVTSSDLQDYLINHDIDARITPFFETDLEENSEKYKHHHRETMRRIKEESRIFVLLCDSADVRDFILNAYDSGMMNGDYAFITINLLLASRFGENTWQGNDGRDADAVKAFEGILDISKHEPYTESYAAFVKDVRNYTAHPPFNHLMQDDEMVDPHAHALYDAIYVYGVALNQSLAEGVDPGDSRAIASRILNTTYEDDIQGAFHIDENGDAYVNYTLRNLRRGEFRSVYHYNTRTEKMSRDHHVTIVWPGGSTDPVLGRPECGWENEYCGIDLTAILGTTAAALVLIVICILGYIIYRAKQKEKQLASSLWKIRYEDLVFLHPTDLTRHSRSKLKTGQSQSMLSARMKTTSSMITGETQQYTRCAMYCGQKVAVKEIQKTQILVTKEVVKELNEVRVMRHANVNPFIGACLEPQHIVIVSQYASKGSLSDVINHEHIKLDTIFKMSFVADIVEGMQYIHNSAIEYHGNLKSSNVVVDCRWTCKIADYGLRRIREGEHLYYESDPLSKGDHSECFRQLWTAPETLRQCSKEREGTRAGDMYSFAIVLQELLLRTTPFGIDCEEPKDVLARVQSGEIPPYRPSLVGVSDDDHKLVPVAEMCWDENPALRPTFSSVHDMLRRMNKGRVSNLVDQMIRLMQKHADHLEDIVEERTQQLAEEQRKTEELLCRMIPKSVAEKLKLGHVVQPESYGSVTVAFSDVVGFTSLAARSTPLQVVDFLNDLYICFDNIIDTYDVYKVETIGDAYMVASGLPIPNGILHAGEIATMSLDLLSAVRRFEIRHIPNKQLQLRIGMHTGPVVAGVVGLKMPRYCLFGDTVNYASRMESTGLALRIHVSPESACVLKQLGNYQLQVRGEISVKGKGMVTSYFLQGKVGFTKELPDLVLAAPLEEHEFK